jgi:hypothetical protein
MSDSGDRFKASVTDNEKQSFIKGKMRKAADSLGDSEWKWRKGRICNSGNERERRVVMIKNFEIIGC